MARTIEDGGRARGVLVPLLALLTLVAAPAPARSAPPDPDPLDELEERVEGLMADLAPAPSDEPPAWARPDEEPLFTFVAIADIHHRRGRDGVLPEALAHVEERIRPAFCLVAGDNVSGASVGNHRELKGMLDEGLDRSYRIVQGDNDAPNYPEVWGTTDWAATFGGVRFLGFGLDRDARGAGVGTIEPETLEWMRQDLRAHRDRPVVLLTHSPVHPVTFLSGPRVQLLLSLHRNATCVLAGHLHHDLDLRLGGVRHLSLPALKRPPAHGLKEFRVYGDEMVVRTHHRTPDGYRFASIWQRVPFRAGRRADPDAPLRFTDPNDLPARETVFDEDLADLWRDLRETLRGLVGRLRDLAR